MADLFADTYAFFALLDGSPAYRKAFTQGEAVTTALNAVEFANGLLRRGHGKLLEEALPAVLNRVIEPSLDVVEGAARFKHDRLTAGAGCSYVDAWGYATARSLGLPFLTGDEDFRGVPGVKFLKA